MDGDTGGFTAVGESVFDGPGAFEGRQNRRMDVEDFLGIFLHEKRRQDPHVAGQDEKVDVGLFQIDDDLALITLRADIIFALQAQRFDAGGLGPFEGIGLAAVRKDKRQFGVDLRGFDRLDDGLQIGTIA